ncbi:hypothetical protein V6N13_054120 [Hibiscus sabdariffa]
MLKESMPKCKISGGRIGESNALTCGFHTEDVLRSTREVEQLITQHTKFHGGECFLEIIGIPEPSVGSKLLLTTRSSDVCRQVGCRVIKVKPLMKEEAWKLFLEKVGHDILNIPGWNQLQSFAEKLDLLGTNIEEIPHGMENLVSLEYLNLDCITKLIWIPYGILSRLSCLQDLIVNGTLISGKEVGSLKKLEILNGRFYDWHNLDMYLQASRDREELVIT